MSKEILHIRHEIRENKLEEAANTIKEVIRAVAIPYKGRKVQPWFDGECYTHRRETLQALHKARDSKQITDLEEYANKRRRYKHLLKEKRKIHIEKEAARIAEEARINPYIALAHKNSNGGTSIEMDKWEKHFSSILNVQSVTPDIIQDTAVKSDSTTRFTREEVRKAIRKAKNKKAAGPDGIFNEHIKDTEKHLTDAWTEMFNKCLERERIPDAWRKSTLKVLYKGKGDRSDPNSYRGIALENNEFKLFSKLLKDKLVEETDHLIPEQQYGFRPQRNTVQAIGNLLQEIEQALQHPKGKYHAVFIDYTKAFDLLNREKLLEKLTHMLGESHTITKVMNNILAYNIVNISDGVCCSRDIVQTNG